jgi:hypothetical protein
MKKFVVKLGQNLNVLTAEKNDNITQNAKQSQYFVVIPDGWTLGTDAEDTEMLLVSFVNGKNPNDIYGPYQLFYQEDFGGYATLFPGEIISAGGTWNYAIEHRYGIESETVYYSHTSPTYSLSITNSVAFKGNGYASDLDIYNIAKSLNDAVSATEEVKSILSDISDKGEFSPYGEYPNLTVGKADTADTAKKADTAEKAKKLEHRLTIWDKNFDGSNDVKIENSTLFDSIYPVGSIYITTVSEFCPAELFGGSWQKVEEKFLFGSGSTYSIGTEGGSADAIIVGHEHSIKTSYSMNPSTASTNTSIYDHTINGDEKDRKTTNNYTFVPKFEYIDVAYTPEYKIEHTIATAYLYGKAASNGVSGEKANLPPYLVVNIWKRIG